MANDSNRVFYISYGCRVSIHCIYKTFLFCCRGTIIYDRIYNIRWIFNIFLFFIYITWFGFLIKVENDKNSEESKIKINPYDNLPLSRKFIDKKNEQIGFFDLGNHILIIGMILFIIFVVTNVS